MLTKYGLICGLLACQVHAQQPTAPADIRGKAVTSAGAPLAKVRLRLIPESARDLPIGLGPVAASTQSNGRGEFAITSVASGRYTLIADRAGYLRQAYGAKAGSLEGTVLVLSAGSTVADLELEMYPTAGVSGRTLDESGDPVRGVMVRALQRRYTSAGPGISAVAATTSNAIGEFNIFDLAPGEYFLQAVPAKSGLEAAETEATSYYGGSNDVDQATPVHVFQGSDLVGINIRILKLPSVSISGRVVGTAAREVILSPSGHYGPNTLLWSDPGSDGQFQFSGVSPGRYTLIAASSTSLKEVYGLMTLDVGLRSLDNIALAANPEFKVSGRVTFAEDQPASVSGSRTAGVKIAFSPDELGSAARSATVDADGRFVVTGLTAAKYRVRLSALPTGSYLARVQMGGRDVPASGVDLSSGAEPDSVNVVLKGSPGEVNGIVQTSDGDAAPGAVVTLIPDNETTGRDDLYRRVRADQTGSFALTDLAPGKYHIFAWRDLDSGAQYDKELLKAHDSQSLAVSVEENSNQAINPVLIVN
jgi:large repetitive protein